MATSIFNTNKATNSSALAGLPTYMTDGDLIGGRIESNCALHTSVQGMPTMCIGVSAEFLHAINEIEENSSCAYGSNAQSTIAECDINGQKYVVAFNKGRIYAQANGAAVASKTALPNRMIFLLSMPYLMKDVEFKDAFDGYMNASDDNEKKSYLAIMSDNAYFRDSTNEITNSFDAGSLLRMTNAKASDPKYFPQEQVGTFSVFNNITSGPNAGPLTAAQSVMTASSFNKAFSIVDQQELSPQARSLVPVLDDRYIITQQHIDVCSTIQKSMDTPYLFRNYLFRGAPGGGKSTFVRIIAAGLGLPLYSDVLRSSIDSDFFSGYFCPKTDGEGNVSLNDYLASLPTAEDIAFDPISAYEKITGEKVTCATPKECMDMLAKKIGEFSKSADADSNAPSLMFVEGLVPKLEEPCLAFYDEVTVPNNPGVISALNTIMDDQEMFTLSDGRIVRRHKKAVMCFAGNFDDVEGCQEPSRAWQNRNNEIIDIEPPRPSELKSLLIAMTGYDTQKNANIPVDTFVSILPELQAIAKDYYGVCGTRALASWLAKAMITGSPIQAAETTIITHSCNDVSCQAEMRVKISDRFRF